MVYFDLEKELRNNKPFMAQLRRIAKEMEDLAELAKSSAHYAAKEAEKLKELYRACRYNPLLLVHHYFPKYPRDKPLSFADYPFVWALLNFMKGGFTVIRGSRQIAKSTAFAVRQVTNAYNIDGFASLYLCPRSQQLKTYATRLRDVERSHIYYTGSGHHEFRKNLDLKEFPNRSKIELAYVLQDPSVVRGKSADEILLDECQDFDADLETEVMQIQSASPYKVKIFAGTSLTTETFLEGKFQQSSQGYWSIKCGCGHWNIPLLEYGVMDMIQKQGPSCVKCGRLLNVYQGEFVHGDRKMLEERQWGFHVPQIILPSVVKDKLRWEEIWKAKISGANKNKFLQELLGIAIEEGTRELTRQHLMDICTLGDYRPLQQRAKNRGYDFVVSGCDWGGSDYNASEKLKVSTTVHVVMGIDAWGKFDILHIKRYYGMDYDDISDEIVANHLRLSGNAIGTDFGVGAVYNNRIRKHLNPDKHLIFMYVGPRCAYIDEPEQNHLYNMWSLNKTESLTVLFDAIKAQRIRCFDWEVASEFLTDFLNMYRAPAELPGGATTFTYRASALKPNDTAQAVNYAFVVGKILLREPIFADNSLQRKLDQILRGNGGGSGPSGFLPGRGGPRPISR